MTTFANYSQYYNLLYHDKNYQEETDFIDALISKHSTSATSILDLGCGTGSHDFLLAEKGYLVCGVDLSESMLEMANDRLQNSEQKTKLEFTLGNVCDVKLDRKFDVVTSLFHVMSYQTTNEMFLAALNTAKQHLKPGGLLIFDFWYGPAVLTQMPTVRVKTIENESIEVLRTATPEIHFNENVVDVNYDVWIKDKTDDKVEVLKEKHPMRYMFLPELKLMLKQAGMEQLECGEWLTGAEASNDSWGVYIIAKV